MHQDIEGFTMPSPEEVNAAAHALKLLADPTRLRILWALLQGETNVACLAELADTSATVISQHLSKLRLAGLVIGRRSGNYIFYAITDDKIEALLRQAFPQIQPAILPADPAGHGHQHSHPH